MDDASRGEAGAPVRRLKSWYRGVLIEVSTEEALDGATFGHADLYAKDRFMARVSVGSANAAAGEVERKLTLLAKAKVDTWAVTGALPMA